MTDRIGPLKVHAYRADDNGSSERILFTTRDGQVTIRLTFAQWRQLDHANELLVAMIPRDW